jgi:hypothetical protein
MVSFRPSSLTSLPSSLSRIEALSFAAILSVLRKYDRNDSPYLKRAQVSLQIVREDSFRVAFLSAGDVFSRALAMKRLGLAAFIKSAHAKLLQIAHEISLFHESH